LFAHSRRIENADNGQKGIEMAKSRCHRGLVVPRAARRTLRRPGSANGDTLAGTSVPRAFAA